VRQRKVATWDSVFFFLWEGNDKTTPSCKYCCKEKLYE
jgi:hypothetical protein